MYPNERSVLQKCEICGKIFIKCVCFNTIWTKIQMEVFVWIRKQTIRH